MKKLIPLFALTAAILTACPPPTPVGTSIPTTGGTVNSSDAQAALNAPSATAGTLVNITLSNDQGQIPAGLTFTSAYNFQITAGSIASGTISIKLPVGGAGLSQIRPSLVAVTINRLYRRSGNFWVYVDGQTSTATSISATVSSFGVYGLLRGVANIKDIVVTPNPLNIVVGATQQMTAVVRDSLNQPMPAVDAPVTWALQSAFTGAAQPQAVIVQPVANTLSSTGLFTANKTGTDTIIATTNQNVTASVVVNIASPPAAQVK